MAQKAPGRPQTKEQSGKPVEMHSVSSSNVDAVGYLAKKKWLYIRFKGGATYVYYSVPRDEFVALYNSGSKGKYVYWSIRDSYDYDRVA